MGKNIFIKPRTTMQGFKTFLYSFTLIFFFLLSIGFYVSNDFLNDKYDLYALSILSIIFSLLLAKQYNQKWLDDKRAKKQTQEAERRIQREIRRIENEECKKARALKRASQKPLSHRIGKTFGNITKNFKKGLEEGREDDN